MFTNNYYTNPDSMHFCFPMKIKKVTNKDADIVTDLIIVNTFFAHLIKEISITRYYNDTQLIPKFSPCEMCQYSDVMLKHLPKKSLKKIQENFFFNKKPVVYNKATIDRKTYMASCLQKLQTKN